jgi:hypothetical protein
MKFSNRMRSVLITFAAKWTVIATGLLTYWPVSFVEIDEFAYKIVTEGSVFYDDSVKTLYSTCRASFVDE